MIILHPKLTFTTPCLAPAHHFKMNVIMIMNIWQEKKEIAGWMDAPAPLIFIQVLPYFMLTPHNRQDG